MELVIIEWPELCPHKMGMKLNGNDCYIFIIGLVRKKKRNMPIGNECNTQKN